MQEHELHSMQKGPRELETSNGGERPGGEAKKTSRGVTVLAFTRSLREEENENSGEN